MKTPSKNGIFMLIPIRIGFTQQPQKEQYIIAGSSADLAVKTTSWVLLGRRTANVYGWKQNPDGSWGNKTYYKEAKGTFYAASTQKNISIELDGLTEGNYYFQVESVLETNVILQNITYYSELAKVTVVPNDIPATSVTIGDKNPYVIFEKTAYPTNVTTTPNNATSKITWSNRFIDSNATDQFTFSPEVGRYTHLESESPSENLVNSVNKSTMAPGIPTVITATATNSDGSTVKGQKQAYYGGLRAKEVDVNSSFNWSLDSTGINELSAISESNTGWKYEWEYVNESTGKTTKLSQYPDLTGISNYTGSVTKLTDLVATQNLLSFAPNSPFIKEAQEASDVGNHYSLRVSFSTTVKNQDSGKNETKVIRSNKAQLRVLKKELKLLKVPSFNFGSIPSNYIYEGNNNTPITSNNDTLSVKDTRDVIDGWSLNVSMTPFNSNLNNKLTSKVTLNLTGSPSLEASFMDDNSSIQLLHDTGNKDYSLNGKIIFNPNPKVTLTKDETFSSKLQWTLVSGNVKAKSLD